MGSGKNQSVELLQRDINSLFRETRELLALHMLPYVEESIPSLFVNVEILTAVAFPIGMLPNSFDCILLLIADYLQNNFLTALLHAVACLLPSEYRFCKDGHFLFFCYGFDFSSQWMGRHYRPSESAHDHGHGLR